MGQRPSRAARGGWRRRLKDARRAVQALLARVVLLAVTRIPYPLLRGLCRGAVAPVCRWWLGAVAEQNLLLAYGDAMPAAERRRLVRAVFLHLAEQIAEACAFYRQGPGFLAGRIDDAEARRFVADFETRWPGGWLGITGHIGNWEFFGWWLGQHSARGRGLAVAKRMANRRLNDLIEDARRRFGIETLYRDDAPSRPVHALKEGRWIALVPDQDVKSLGGVFVDVFGHPAYTPVGPARLAYAANVPMAVGCLVRDGARYRIEVEGVLWPDTSQPKAREVQRLTQEWSRLLEAAIRRHPEQWAWYHRRWRTTPERLAARGRTPVPEPPDAS